MQCALVHLLLKTWQIKVNGELKLAMKMLKGDPLQTVY